MRGLTRGTCHVVFGRTLLTKATAGEIEQRVASVRRAGRHLLSENGFLRMLGLARVPETSDLGRQSVIDQSRLAAHDFDILSLFDAFEHDREPYSFRDLILAKKYAGLVAGGANWAAIARSVHRSGPVASLTAKSLHVEGFNSIYARHEEGYCELNGQLLFDLGAQDDAALDEIFAEAEAAEEAGRHDLAAELYGRCLAIDPANSIAAFNRANCLRALQRGVEAAHEYARALKLDGELVEAWFNLAGLIDGAWAPRFRQTASAQGDRTRRQLRGRDLQPGQTGIRRWRPGRGAPLVVSLPGTRQHVGVGAHGGSGRSFRGPPVQAEVGRLDAAELAAGRPGTCDDDASPGARCGRTDGYRLP